jgi:hypothetical protein
VTSLQSEPSQREIVVAVGIFSVNRGIIYVGVDSWKRVLWKLQSETGIINFKQSDLRLCQKQIQGHV